MKKIIFTILLFLISFNICYASTNTFERTEENPRVNKKWDINNKNINDVFNTPSVDASEKVYDFANILTDEEEIELKKQIDEFINKTGFDLVFVFDSFSYSYDSENEDYAANFYDYNDFGIDDEKYSGILFLINEYPNQRYYNMYTFGNAQLYYQSARTEPILDDIYYNLYNKYYMDGLKTFIDDCYNYYEEGIQPDLKDYYIDDMGYLQKRYKPPILIGLLVSIIATAITIGILVKKNFMIAQETKALEYLDQNSIHYTRKLDQFITSHTTSHYISSSSSGGYSGGGSFHSSGGSSGGGHSSGGGRHM